MLSPSCNAKDTLRRSKHDCHFTPEPAQQPVKKVAVNVTSRSPAPLPPPPAPLAGRILKYVCGQNQLTLATYARGLVQAVMLAGNQVTQVR